MTDEELENSYYGPVCNIAGCVECYVMVIECNFCGEISTVQNPDNAPRINCPNCGISNSVPRD